jgi:cation diffusion facilitator family transporter
MDLQLRKKEAEKVTLIGFFVNVILSVLKLIAGVLGNSAAMVADAVHSVSDFATDVIVLVFMRISSKPSDEEHRYGHGKFETFATLIIAFALCGVGVSMLVSGVKDVWGNLVLGIPLEKPSYIALWAALISILTKEILYRYTILVGKKIVSEAVIANAWHHRSDAFSSIGTLIGISGAIFLGDKFHVLDPIAAMVVSLFIIKVGVELSLPSINELLEKSLPKETEEEIIAVLNTVTDLHEPHNLHTRKIGSMIAIEVHVRINKRFTVEHSHQIASIAENKLRERFGTYTHISIHVEPME